MTRGDSNNTSFSLLYLYATMQTNPRINTHLYLHHMAYLPAENKNIQ
jgi:hypothetical protein